jgi:hypothetical protein
MNKKILPATLLILMISVSACGGSTPAAETPPTPPAADPPTRAVSPPTDAPPSPEAAAPTEEAVTEGAPSPVSFANDVMPILENRCIECHGGRRTREGLDVKTYESLMQGSQNGPVVIPGSADESLFVELIVKGEMPDRGPKVTPGELKLIMDWVNQGALNN